MWVQSRSILVDRDLFMKERISSILEGRFWLKVAQRPGDGRPILCFHKARVLSFMQDLDEELWKLGIPGKTRHNEAAPGQHEIAPILAHQRSNRPEPADDGNHEKGGRRHGFACLLHENHCYVNGSGKHINWNIGTDDGYNLLKPGPQPHHNNIFLLMLAVVMRAVDVYSGVIRSSAANSGNDCRLGAHEAPPAIISIFLGDQLTDIIEQIEKTGEATNSKGSDQMEMECCHPPQIQKGLYRQEQNLSLCFYRE